jgi:hypothetical protein
MSAPRLFVVGAWISENDAGPATRPGQMFPIAQKRSTQGRSSISVAQALRG